MATGGDQRDWTRRRVLAAGCAAAGAMAVGVAARAAAGASDDKEGPYGPFKMGLQSYSLRGYKTSGRPDTEKALAVTEDLGIHYWEAYPDHIPMASPVQIAERKRWLKTAGVTLLGYGVVQLGKDEVGSRRYFDFAKMMGLKYLSASPEPGSFDLLDKLVEEYGVAVGIHNHGPGDRHYDKIEKIEKAIKDHHQKIGCCIDTGHFLRSREDPVHAVEVFGKRVYGVHLKDVKDASDFTILGQGDLRTVDLLKALAHNNYEYCLAIEYEEKEENPVEDIKACLAVARKAIAEVKNG